MAVETKRPSTDGPMMLETPLLRVSRPVAACSRCRAAKVKCDGKLPACTACEKSNRASECSSTNDQFARGKERSYVATLESRVEKLEKKILEARARRKSSSVLMHESETGTPRRTSTDTVKAVNHISKRAARRKEASDIDELVSDFGLLAVNATARDFYGFTTEMSYARLILSASSKEALPTGLTKALPPRYAATPHIQHYLNNVFTLLPVFEEATLYSSIDAVYHLDDIATAFDHWTVRMVLAIACLSQSDQRGDTLYTDAVGHLNAALEHAEEVLHPGFISSIQGLILLVLYAMMDPHHFDSWTLIGAASRTMVDLGIHQDPSRCATMPKSKLEIRRRVYWCVYVLDRSTSLVQTRAFSFSDDAAHVSLPFSTSPASAASPKHSSPQAHVFLQSFDAALDLFRIREIQSKWYMDLFQSGRDPWEDPYPYIWKTYAKMTEWFEEMPQNILPSSKSFFELELLYSYVYILSPSPRIPHIHEYAQRLIFEHCIAYSTNLLALLSTPSNTTKPPVTFYDAMRAYMTGRQFVDVLSRNIDVILDPTPPTPPASAPTSTSEDPLAPPAQASPPPFPSPYQSDIQPTPQDPTQRAITAISDFTAILSHLGLRFGFTHWRDRFQRESAALNSHLYNRSSIVSHTSPPSQYQAYHQQQQQPHAQQEQYPQQYHPQQLHPQQQPHHPQHNQQQLYNTHPTTPPTAYPPQPSPFSTSPYPSPFGPPIVSGGEQNQAMLDWTTPSPQPLTMPEMPKPSEGRIRQALVYGSGSSAPGVGQNREAAGGEGEQMQGQENGEWNTSPNQNGHFM